MGTLWGVALEPRERLLLRIVVERPQSKPLIRVKVPFASIVRADEDQVVLSVGPDQMEGLPAHETGDDGKRSRRRRRGDEVLEKILTRQTQVYCRDGEAGPLSGVTIDDRSGDLEEIAFEIGALTPRTVRLPISELEDLEEGRLSIRLDRDGLEGLSDGRL